MIDISNVREGHINPVTGANQWTVQQILSELKKWPERSQFFVYAETKDEYTHAFSLLLGVLSAHPLDKWDVKGDRETFKITLTRTDYRFRRSRLRLE